jgi:CHASE3 domain sensor protein
MKYGMPAWEELLRTEGRLRKMKAAQMEEQQKFIERLVLIVVVTAIVALGGAALWYWADYLKDLSK